MKNIAILFLAFGIFGLIACGGNGHENQTQSGTKTNDSGGYGAVITAENALSIADIKDKVTAEEALKTKVRATVDEVCQKKGCWMTLNREDGKTMRVTFKDYGFFVPKDISGKEVIIEGIAKIEETNIEDLKHYAKDAGKPQAEIDAITEPEYEMVFEATGVIVL